MRIASSNLFVATVGLLAVLANPRVASSQEGDWSPARPQPRANNPAPRAILIRNAEADPGAPPYALVDQFGRVQRYVEPTPGVDLEAHVGRQVRVAHDTGKTLLATQLDLPDELRQLTSDARPARFVPPRRLERLDGSRRAPIRRVQFDGEAIDPADAEPIDLDAVIADQGRSADSLPAPANESEPLAPIAAEPYSSDDGYTTGDYTGEIISAGDCPDCEDRYRSEMPTRQSAACDCQECRKKRMTHAPCSCNRCRNDAWCGPTCSPPSKRGPYGRAEYLFWWFDDMDTPPLVTQNDSPSLPDFDTAGTRSIYGGEILDDPRNGLRFTAGAWLDNERDFAIEGDLLFFETETEVFAAGDIDGGGDFTIGRPFYDIAPTDPEEVARIITLPGTTGGTIGVTTRSEFESVGLRLRTGICCREVGGGGAGCNSCGPLARMKPTSRPTAVSRVDVIGGYRYVSLDESIAFNETTTPLSAPDPVNVNESFATDNDFHGVDLGFIYEWEARRWAVELVSKIALGVTDQEVRINGSTSSATIDSAGGLLAQSSNIGTYSRDRFSVIPELSARVAYRITPQLRASLAYSLLYWSSVVRPGDQIDYTIDSRVIPPAVGAPSPYRHPHFAFDDTAIWAHGFNLGLEYVY